MPYPSARYSWRELPKVDVTAEPANISFENISKSFPLGQGSHVRALQDFSLVVAPGELLALAGPSGSGKTTALRLVAGLDVPNTGKIFIGGKDVADVLPKNRGVGMVFQNHALYPHLTARENLAFGLEIQKLPKAEMIRRIGNAAEVLHLAALLDKRPDALSGGERQRVALGRAIVSQPKILLLDEPFSNLDPHLRGELRGEIRKLQREFNLTILFVTHDQADVLALADRIGVIYRGKLEQTGSPEEIYKKPQNRFVASFFGEMNFLRGRSVNGKFELAPGESQFMNIPLPSINRLVERMELMLGFRPEAIAAPNEALRRDYLVPFRIEVLDIEYGGAAYRTRGKIGSQAITVNTQHRPQSNLMDVTLDLRETLWFDAASGQLL